MSIDQLLNTPATIIRRLPGEAEDDYGNEIPVPEEVEVLCEVQKAQRASEEPDDQGELSDTHWTGFFPAGTDLQTGDAVRVDGLGVLEMVGAPWPVRNPRTKEASHLEASLRWTAGSEDGS